MAELVDALCSERSGGNPMKVQILSSALNLFFIIFKMSNNSPLVHLVSEDEVSPQVQQLFQQFKKSTGKIPKWMQVMANCEDTLLGFFALFKSVMDDAPLNSLLKWKVAYVVSEINKCKYCVSVSEAKLKALGMENTDISQLNKSNTPKEQIAIDYAKATTKHSYKISPELIKKLKENFTDKEIVELTSVIGLFNYINRFNDALKVLPE